MKSSPTAAAAPPPPDSASQSPGMSNCYVFKSLLQEYSQKAEFATPEYDTVKEGPAHGPVFRSSVVVNGVKYDSLPGFFNRKVAEQSAAEVALIEIQKSGEKTECIPAMHETGLCKNMLQVYAQKMNYAIPAYICTKQPTGASPFTCTIDIGGIQYIGAAARTKKEAEIKAARTALLAIERSSLAASNGASQYTVLPGQKKVVQTQAGTKKQLKPKKDGFKKKFPRTRPLRKNGEQANLNGDQTGSGLDVDASNGATGSTDVNMAEEHIVGLIVNEVEQVSDKGKIENGRPPQDSVIKVETDVDASRVASDGTNVSMDEQLLEELTPNEGERECNKGIDEHGIPSQDSNIVVQMDVNASRVPIVGTDVSMSEQHLEGLNSNVGEQQSDTPKDEHEMPPQDPNIKVETKENCEDAQLLEPVICHAIQSINNVEYVDDMPPQDPNIKVETNENCEDAQLLEPVICHAIQSINNVEYVDDMPIVKVETS